MHPLSFSICKETRKEKKIWCRKLGKVSLSLPLFGQVYREINCIHKIHPFLVYVLNTDKLIQSCNHYLYQDIKQFHHSPNSLKLLCSHCLSVPLSPGNSCSVFCLWGFSFFRMLCKCNHTICSLLSLASFS